MDDNNRKILQDIASGSFSKVIERNDRIVLIESNTEKVKNSVLKEFIDEALNDGYTHEDLVSILLALDEAVENNEVRKTLKEYL